MWEGDCADLLCEREEIAPVPELGDLAVLDSEDVDSFERHPTTRSFEPHVRTCVRAPKRPPDRDFVACDDDVVGCEALDGERGSERFGVLLCKLRAATRYEQAVML